ncbi:hypothetical protein COEREDRAFT_10896 [Coemansia reversa NRRL 1564]|uniref:Uncharacterized protein n=1 Tax=Coemansia reversa (strain ATCC 12441 / NRRL 1564) TaxID=763665 RepID=A0A2G5B4N4_COERN|nr:hypothetical protein COEREDRAFT_10896 [Coemansia reversa NRRL 1564]|eukprot:PIA13959.1 hypothetical protein COEREDRAFT_10896 [Coemansia reversa NRRL 1564]
MESWAIALLCVMMALAGAILGGLSVFLVGRHLHRNRCGKRLTDTFGAEECQTQMIDAEKSVLQRIVCTNGASRLSLKFPEPTLGVPIPPSPPTDAVISLRSTAPSPEPVSPPCVPRPPDTPEIVIIPTTADRRKSSISTSPSTHEDAVEYAASVTTATSTAAVDSTSFFKTSNNSGAITGLGMILPADSTAPTANFASPVASLSNGRQSIFLSTTTTVAKPSKKPAAVVFHPSAFLSSPAAGRRRRSAARAGSGSVEWTDDGAEEASDTGVEIGGKVTSYQPSLKSAPVSIDESNLEAISVINTPMTALIPNSPCGSSDFVVVPPSPSIASLYGLSMAGTLSHPPSILSPRSVNMAKASSSPGCLTGSSLFSPPPIPNYKRFSEARTSDAHTPRGQQP